MSTQPVLVIAGYGRGLGESLAAMFADRGYRVVGLSRKPEQPTVGSDGPDMVHLAVDLTDEAATQAAFSAIAKDHGLPTVLVHNVAELVIEPFAQIDAAMLQRSWQAGCLTAFHCAVACLATMENTGGTMIFTGATASIRGGRNFAAFASAKFALRGMVQSIAREYGPKGVHIVHTLIDGLIWCPQTIDRFDPSQDACLHPDDIAATYYNIVGQPSSAWTHEIDLRPASEGF